MSDFIGQAADAFHQKNPHQDCANVKIAFCLSTLFPDAL